MSQLVQNVHIRRLTRTARAGALAAAVLAPGGALAEDGELVMFRTASCPWCALWEREVGTLYDKTAEARVLRLRRVDAGREQSGGVLLARPVEFTPTFVIVACGRELGRITGYPWEDHFWGLLRAEIERHRARLAASC